MSEALISFLISILVILAIALFIPCLEGIVRLIRRSSQPKAAAAVTEIRPARNRRRNVA